MMHVKYEPPVYGDPSFPIIFHQDGMDAARRAVYTNWHAGVELLYCFQGKGVLYHGAEEASFEAGDIVVISSNVPHTLHLGGEVCRYYCMIVDLPFLVDAGIDADGAHFHPVVRDAEVTACYREIVRAHGYREPYYKPQVLALALRIFVALMRRYLAAMPNPMPSSGKRNSQAIIQALEYIREHLCESIQIDQISRHVGISKYYFCKLFRAYTGMSVLQYINMLKCDYARTLLLDSHMTVSEVAHMLGYQNMSYFSRLYKKHVNMLPSEEKMGRPRRAGVAL